MVEQRPAHTVELVDDPRVLVVHALDLGRELRPRLVRRGEPGLRGALLLGRAEPLELPPQRRRGALGLRARRRFLFEQLALFVHDAARLFGGAQVAAGERLHLGQALARAAAARDRGGVDGRRLDGEHRGGRQRRAGPLGEHLVEEQLARTSGLGRCRGRRSRPGQREAAIRLILRRSDPSTLDHSP